MNRYYILVVLILTAFVCNGRIRVPITNKNERKEPKIEIKVEEAKPDTIRVEKQEVKPDTVYSIATIKQHGWFLPLGEITKEQALHMPESYMFTNKNKDGHWTKVESVNSYGKYAKGTWIPYILSNLDEDSEANSEWVQRIRESCIVEILADPTGKEVVQERVYDENYNIVYVFSRTPIGIDSLGNNHYIGSYKDGYGLPAEMRDNSDYSYGTIVKITEDQWGHDHIIEYLDSKGYSKLNADSVYRSVHDYNKDGDKLRFGSQNENGEYVLDSWGNCGVVQTWNTDHTIASSMYTDTNWKGMAMPSPKSGLQMGVVKALYKYDDYKRIEELKFVDVDDSPRTNAYGSHKINFEYDSKGNIVKMIGYDIVGNLSAIDKSGTAIYENKYDDVGRLLEAKYLDKNRKPVSTEGSSSKIRKSYDPITGEMILNEQFVVKGDEEYLEYKEEYKPTYSYIRIFEGPSRFDFFDDKARTTYIGFYDEEVNPQVVEGRASEIYTYKDGNGVTQQIGVTYDQDGYEVDVNGYCRQVTLIDSVNWTQTIFRYNTKGELRESFLLRSSPKFSGIIGQCDVNGFGCVARSGGASGVMHYKANVTYGTNNSYSRLSDIAGVDEFGEPDYIKTTELVYYYQKIFPNGENKFYDENNNEIVDQNILRNSLPKIMTIEVTDSSAYDLGIKDNDLILLYGKYTVDPDIIVSEYEFRQDWTLRSVLDAKDERRMVVFRVTDAAKGEYGLVEIAGLKGTCSEIGFIPHIRFLTGRQLSRIKEVIDKETERAKPIVTYKELKEVNNEGGSNYVLMAYAEMIRENRNKPYAKQVTDPSVLLGSCVADRKLQWTREDGENTESFEKMLNFRTREVKKYPRQDIYVTKDGATITHMLLEEQAAFVEWFDATISDKDYEKLRLLFDCASDSIRAKIQKHKSIRPKEFYGRWKSEGNDSVKYYPEVYMNLVKDGSYSSAVVNYGMVEITGVTAIFKEVKQVSGKWDNGGNWLFLNAETDTVSLRCVDILGEENEARKKNYISYLNTECEQSKEALLKIIKYYAPINDELSIDTIGKGVIEAIYSTGVPIKLFKTKEKINDFVSEKEQYQNSNTFEQTVIIDEQSPYIGRWNANIATQEEYGMDVQAGYTLSKTGDALAETIVSCLMPTEGDDYIRVVSEIEASGYWHPVEGGFKIDVDPSKISKFFYVDNADEDINKQLRNELDGKSGIIQEVGMSVVKAFFEPIMVTEVDSAKMVADNFLFNRASDTLEVVLCKTEGDSGFLVENGYSGMYVILEWCDWNCTNGATEYNAEFEKQKDNAKRIVLLPMDIENEDIMYKDIIELDCPKGLLGLRISSIGVGYLDYKREILSRYKDFKMR